MLLFRDAIIGFIGILSSVTVSILICLPLPYLLHTLFSAITILCCPQLAFDLLYQLFLSSLLYTLPFALYLLILAAQVPTTAYNKYFYI